MSIKKTETLPKKIFYIQRQRKNHSETVGGAYLQYNQIAYPPGWMTHWLENNYITEVLPWEWEFWAPPSGSPAWGSGIGRRSPQSIWLWRPAGLNLKNSTGLGEPETPLLEGAHKVPWAPGPSTKAVTPKEPGLGLPAGLGGSLGQLWLSPGT